MAKADKTLDIRGIQHPRSRAVVEATMSGLAQGQTLNVITSARITYDNIADLCADRGYTLICSSDGDGIRSFTLRR